MSYGRIVKKNPAHVCAGFFFDYFYRSKRENTD